MFHSSRMRVSNELVLAGEYKIAAHIDAHVIVDVGACDGAAAGWFWATYPNAKIYSYEPAEVSCHNFIENTIRYRDRIVLTMAAVSPNGSKLWLSGANDGMRSSLNHYGTEQSQDCACIQPDQLPANIDILKVDCEGAEVYVIQGVLAHQLPKAIVFEYHCEQYRLTLEAMLTRHGYTLERQQLIPGEVPGVGVQIWTHETVKP